MRSIAKKAFIASFKLNASPDETADAVRVALVEAEKYNDDLETIIHQIKEMKFAKSVETVSTTKIETSEVNVKSFNDLSDKMVRGTAKKAFLAGKKLHSDIPKILGYVQKTLSESDMLNEEVTNLLNKLNASLSASAVKEDSKTLTQLFDIKKLNDIEDRMARGTAKKTFMAGKKAGLSSNEVLTIIKNALNDADKMDDVTSKLLSTIEGEL